MMEAETMACGVFQHVHEGTDEQVAHQAQADQAEEHGGQDLKASSGVVMKSCGPGCSPWSRKAP